VESDWAERFAADATLSRSATRPTTREQVIEGSRKANGRPKTSCPRRFS
jgi:hypothetical protein